MSRPAAGGYRNRRSVVSGVSQRDIDPLTPGRLGSLPREPDPGRLPCDNLDLPQPEPTTEPQRLDHRLLGGKPRRQVPSGPRPRRCVLTLGHREDSFGQAWMALQSALHAVDLKQVDADTGHRAGGYLPMLAISFAVARSPDAPAPIAT
jgi:hypothetical protein